MRSNPFATSLLAGITYRNNFDMENEIVTFVRIDFDSMENHSPEHETELGTFVGEGSITAYGMFSLWLGRQNFSYKPYLGYNCNIYPRFKIVIRRISNDRSPDYVVTHE